MRPGVVACQLVHPLFQGWRHITWRGAAQGGAGMLTNSLHRSHDAACGDPSPWPLAAMRWHLGISWTAPQLGKSNAFLAAAQAVTAPGGLVVAIPGTCA